MTDPTEDPYVQELDAEYGIVSGKEVTDGLPEGWSLRVRTWAKNYHQVMVLPPMPMAGWTNDWHEKTPEKAIEHAKREIADYLENGFPWERKR